MTRDIRASAMATTFLCTRHFQRTLSAAVVLVALALPALAFDAVVGTVTYVRDGDTLCVGQIEIRLEGIDAPELNENCWRGGRSWKCGPDATKALRQKTEGQTLTCDPKYCDARGRTVALCRLNGEDVSEAMVATGWAIDWPHYSAGRYRLAQEGAHNAGRGLWADGGGMSWRMMGRPWWPLGTRRDRGPYPPCKSRCAPAAADR
jgi:endonuclease YncB( thermonuclease family)